MGLFDGIKIRKAIMHQQKGDLAQARGKVIGTILRPMGRGIAGFGQEIDPVQGGEGAGNSRGDGVPHQFSPVHEELQFFRVGKCRSELPAQIA